MDGMGWMFVFHSKCRERTKKDATKESKMKQIIFIAFAAAVVVSL